EFRRVLFRSAVDARALAVPHAEHAVVSALATQLGLLRAPYRGGGEVLVDAALETDVARFEILAGPLELGVAAVTAVELLLHQAQPDQGLEAGHENPRLGEVVFVVERDGTQLHAGRASAGQFALRDSIMPEGAKRADAYTTYRPR